MSSVAVYTADGGDGPVTRIESAHVRTVSAIADPLCAVLYLASDSERYADPRVRDSSTLTRALLSAPIWQLVVSSGELAQDLTAEAPEEVQLVTLDAALIVALLATRSDMGRDATAAAEAVGVAVDLL